MPISWFLLKPHYFNSAFVKFLSSFRENRLLHQRPRYTASSLSVPQWTGKSRKPFHESVFHYELDSSKPTVFRWTQSRAVLKTTRPTQDCVWVWSHIFHTNAAPSGLIQRSLCFFKSSCPVFETALSRFCQLEFEDSPGRSKESFRRFRNTFVMSKSIELRFSEYSEGNSSCKKKSFAKRI